MRRNVLDAQGQIKNGSCAPRVLGVCLIYKSRGDGHETHPRPNPALP
jgi:hypothetical protein